MKLIPTLKSSSALLSLMLLLPTASLAADLKVVTSIKPVHSLVSGVMDGVGTPDLIVTGNTSPHDFALKPSDAKAIENSDVIFWIGHGLEAFLEKPIESVGTKAVAVELMETKGLTLFEYRDVDEIVKAASLKKDHDHDHDHDHKAEKAADKHDDHDHKEHSHDDHKHDDHKEEAKAGHDDHGHEGHDHGGQDAHIWLDPQNAAIMVTEIAAQLSKADPDNSATYQKNAKTMVVELSNLEMEMKTKMSKAEGLNYVVFHDAYQYFENRFGLSPNAVVTVSAEVAPGAKRISEIREAMESQSITCVFSEPQFASRVADTLIEGTKANTQVLDPLGANITNGKELYFQLIREMGDSFVGCASNS